MSHQTRLDFADKHLSLEIDTSTKAHDAGHELSAPSIERIESGIVFASGPVEGRSSMMYAYSNSAASISPDDSTDALQASPSPGNMKKKKQTSAWSRFVEWCDVYAIETRNPNSFGSIMTLAIVVASAAYAVLLFVQLSRAPLREQNAVKWAAGHFFPGWIRCTAASGCLVSNHHPPNHGSAACISLPKGERMQLDLTWSSTPESGLSILARVNGSHEIAIIESDMYQDPLPAGSTNKMMGTIEDNVVMMPSSLVQGTGLAWYVETVNSTRSGKGALRREFFVQTVNLDGKILPGSTSCVSGEGWVQSRIRVMPQWNQVTVDHPMSLTEWFGTASGMYAAFVSWGAVLLSVWEFWHSKILRT